MDSRRRPRRRDCALRGSLRDRRCGEGRTCREPRVVRRRARSTTRRRCAPCGTTAAGRVPTRAGRSRSPGGKARRGCRRWDEPRSSRSGAAPSPRRSPPRWLPAPSFHNRSGGPAGPAGAAFAPRRAAHFQTRRRASLQQGPAQPPRRLPPSGRALPPHLGPTAGRRRGSSTHSGRAARARWCRALSRPRLRRAGRAWPRNQTYRHLRVVTLRPVLRLVESPREPRTSRLRTPSISAFSSPSRAFGDVDKRELDESDSAHPIQEVST